MLDKPSFDLPSAHQFFSADCFNRVWELLDKVDRRSEDDEEMVNLCHASIWHWMQRADCTEQKLGIGYWQASRAYSVIGRIDMARCFANKCLTASQSSGPFYLGYAYEALARCEKAAQEESLSKEYLQKAHEFAALITDEAEKKMLLDDLQSIGWVDR